MFTAKPDNELKSLLKPVRRKLQNQVLIQQITLYGLWGAGGSGLLLLAARFWPIPYYAWLAVAMFPLGLAIGWMSTKWRQTTWQKSAQAADGNGLAQRVETAWEHRESTSSVAVMQQGRIVEVGARDALFANPQHEYTRGLMSAIPVADPVLERRRRAEAAELLAER